MANPGKDGRPEECTIRMGNDWGLGIRVKGFGSKV